MESDLTIKDVVERADLDRRTAKYVLQRKGATERLRLPEGDERKRRAFSIDEAIRLSLCTQFVMIGVPVESAEAIMLWTERRWKNFTKNEPGLNYLFDGLASNPWNIVLVSNGKYIQVSRDRPDRRNNLEMLEDIDAFYSTADWKLVRFVEIPRHIPRIEWSLSHLAGSLARIR